MFHPNKYNLILVCVFFLFIFTVTDVIGEESGIKVIPPFQEIIITDNLSTPKAEVELQNLTETALSFRLSVVDLHGVDPDGKVFYHTSGQHNQDFGLVAFISLDREYIILNPLSSIKIPIQINNHVDLSPGGHYAGLIAQQTDVNSQVQPGIASLILVRKVGGERINLSLQTISWPDVFIQFSIPDKVMMAFNNQGNVHVIPRGIVTITDMFGRDVYRGIINEASFYVFPQSIRNIPVKIKSLTRGFPLMIYKLDAKGREPISNTALLQEHYFLYISIPVFMLLIFIITVIFGYLVKRKIQ